MSASQAEQAGSTPVPRSKKKALAKASAFFSGVRLSAREEMLSIVKLLCSEACFMRLLTHFTSWVSTILHSGNAAASLGCNPNFIVLHTLALFMEMW